MTSCESGCSRIPRHFRKNRSRARLSSFRKKAGASSQSVTNLCIFLRNEQAIPPPDRVVPLLARSLTLLNYDDWSTTTMEESAALVNGAEAGRPQQVTDTLERIRELLEQRYGIDKQKIEMESELTALGLDSLSLVEYAFDLEKYLNLSLSDLPNELVTIGDLVHYVDGVRSRSGT